MMLTSFLQPTPLCAERCVLIDYALLGAPYQHTRPSMRLSHAAPIMLMTILTLASLAILIDRHATIAKTDDSRDIEVARSHTMDIEFQRVGSELLIGPPPVEGLLNFGKDSLTVLVADINGSHKTANGDWVVPLLDESGHSPGTLISYHELPAQQDTFDFQLTGFVHAQSANDQRDLIPATLSCAFLFRHGAIGMLSCCLQTRSPRTADEFAFLEAHGSKKTGVIVEFGRDRTRWRPITLSVEGGIDNPEWTSSIGEWVSMRTVELVETDFDDLYSSFHAIREACRVH